jgi:hypothetical protein
MGGGFLDYLPVDVDEARKKKTPAEQDSAGVRW